MRSSRKRSIKKADATPKYCFVVEGHTEASYLEKVLGAHKHNIIINPPCSDPLNLVNEGISRQGGELNYEKVFVLFDSDVYASAGSLIHQIQVQLDRYNKQQVTVFPICSSYFFEYVLHLHFQPNNLIPFIANSQSALKAFGFDNHKQEPTRSRLMVSLKENPNQIRGMYKGLKKRDQEQGLHKESRLAVRMDQNNSPNSNFYQVLDELHAQGVLTFPLQLEV